MTFRPKFRLTVTEALYQATCEAVDQPFAESYLFGSTVVGAYLTPRTLTGYEKMRGRLEFMRLLKRLNLTLVRPEPWPGDGTRMAANEA